MSEKQREEDDETETGTEPDVSEPKTEENAVREPNDWPRPGMTLLEMPN